MAAADPYTSTNKFKRYDIFKNTKYMDEVDEIKNLLANLAVADTAHDIDKKDKGIPGITGQLGNPSTVQAKMYQKGIPVPYTNNILDEESAVGSVIDNNSFVWGGAAAIHNDDFKRCKYVPLRVMKYIKEGKRPTGNGCQDYTDSNPIYVRNDGQTHTIDTVNGNKYTVTYFDVKPETAQGTKGDLINAKIFFEKMNENTVESKNIAFVVDCTSITFEDILNSGPNLGENFKTYLIKSSEGENDPGGKTNLQDKSFKKYDTTKSNTGVRYRAAVPHNLTKSNSYSYSFKNYQTSPYTQFFTKYNFELSELQFDDKYIFSSLTTKLNIIDPNNTVPPKIVPNSGDMNNIGAVSTIIRDLLTKITGYKNKASDIDVFDYNCALQQKRAGDWLQALLTCLVASGERKFCEYNSPAFNAMSVFKKKEINSGTVKDAATGNDIPLDFKPENVYLVTHDRILLAFALLLGVNVIFTHHYTGSGKDHSFHSVLVYKITDPLERSASKITVMEEFYQGVKTTNNFSGQLDIAERRLNKIYGNFTQYVNKFICGKNNCSDVAAVVEEDNLEKHIGDFKGIIGREGAINANEINSFTQKIFAAAFKIALIKSTFPDLDNLGTDIGVIQELRSEFTTIKGLLKSTLPDARNPTSPSINADEHFLKYNNYQSENDATKLKYDDIVEKLSKYHALISKVNKFTQINEKYDEFMDNLNKHLKKNPTFALILAWRTSNVPKCNLWVQYINILKPNWAYINDKNIFLYELTNLGDDEKEKICKVYLDLFNKIKIPANVAGNAALQAKTQQNVLSFCLEVFVNLGPFVKNDGDSAAIKAAIDDYLSSDQTLPESAEQRNESTVKNVFKPNRIGEVIAELNALNDTKKVDEGTADEHTKIIVKIPNNPNNPDGPLDIYDPVLTPVLIEELIEIKVNNDNPQASEDKQDITGTDALDDLRLDVTDDANNEFQPNPEKRDLTFQGDPVISQIKGVEFKNTQEEAFNAAPAAAAADELVLQPDTPDGEQIGGRAKRNQNILFIFDNKMAPRYLAATKLFLKRQTVEGFDYILDRLSGASRIMIDELRPRNPEELSETDLTQSDLSDISSSRPAAPADLQENEFVEPLKGGQTAGAHEEIDSLISSVESILKSEKFAFHPLLSIYLILESYCTELGVTYIKDSWDYEIFVQFFIIINKMINNLLNIYSDDNNTNINKLRACMVGYGLRELIFTSPQCIERDPICTEALNIELNNYNPLSKMFSILVNRVCGSVNQTPEDIVLGSKYISSAIFKEYATGIEFNRILNSNVPDVDTYQLALKSNELFLAVGRKIISDTNGEPNDELLGLTRSNSLPVVNNLEEEERLFLPPSSPSSDKRVADEIEDELPVKRLTITPEIGSGGKKTRKHIRHLKNRTTKRNNRITRRRTTKKNKRVRKNNRSRK